MHAKLELIVRKAKFQQHSDEPTNLTQAWKLLREMEQGAFGDENLPDLYCYIMLFRAVRNSP